MSGGTGLRDTPPADPVNSPAHYRRGAVEVIDFIEQVAPAYGDIGYHIGNVLKYVSRAPHKGKLDEDLRKAKWYLERAIAQLDK